MSADENEEDTQTDEDSSSEESGGDNEEKSAQQLAQEKEEESEEAQKVIEELENSDELPEKAEDWPSGPAKYETFGLDDPTYGEGATEKLGPANLERHADGSVSIDGEKVDNPEDYKGEPIQAAVDKNQEDDEEDDEDEGSEDKGGEDEGDDK